MNDNGLRNFFTIGLGFWRLAVIGLVALLSACQSVPSASTSTAQLRDGKPTGLTHCCMQPERSPPWLVSIVELSAPITGSIIGAIEMRKGYLDAQPAAKAKLMSVLRPTDIILVRSGGRLSGKLIPGHFAHALVYLGREADLKKLGLWNDPAVKPNWPQIRDGEYFIEADSKGIHLSNRDAVFNVDSVLVIRRPMAASERRRALRKFYQEVGGPFDFHFDASQPDEKFCSELVNSVIPERHMPLREVYGRKTILPDDYAALAATGCPHMRFVLYVKSTSKSWRMASRRELVRDLEETWKPAISIASKKP